jgi:hypothetical protein
MMSDNTAAVASPEARAARLCGIAELLADSDFDSVGHLHNDDARFLLAEVQRLCEVERQVERVRAALRRDWPTAHDFSFAIADIVGVQRP